MPKIKIEKTTYPDYRFASYIDWKRYIVKQQAMARAKIKLKIMIII